MYIDTNLVYFISFVVDRFRCLLLFFFFCLFVCFLVGLDFLMFFELRALLLILCTDSVSVYNTELE